MPIADAFFSSSPQPFERPTEASPGIKPKVLAARTQKALANCRQQMERLAAPWGDVDSSVENALTDLLNAFDDFKKQIEETVEWLNQEAGT
ncbi:hypothetical protein [Mesorhizobium sp. LSJC264A00]|uniref:hypothetical protein n=1 Tax=unclassified Mesorhizobium TaxID=325217 RepID=UPI0003CEF3C4|nr:hypothetical protein [Mesorhizobium sp. LSJC264A00]ESX24167.1 hypothetical protein X767_13155 [Mesorhizobium sp. LSJC264A00]